jgi:hypothetical protein
MSAACAQTFGGAPEQYDPGLPYEVSDYPEIGLVKAECETFADYTTIDESPPVANLQPFHDESLPQMCIYENYCAWEDAIVEAFPSHEIDPLCNTAGEGTPGSPGPWLCVGSKDYSCGVKIEDGPELICHRPEDISSPDSEICVLAADAAEAASDCTQLCEEASTAYEENENVTQSLDCDIYTEEVVVWASNPPDECYMGTAYPGEMNVKRMLFSAALILDSGASASSSRNVAFLDYRIDNCSTEENCDVLISGLSLPDKKYEGTFLDVSGGVHAYAIDRVFAQLLKPVKGRVEQGRVYFPSEAFIVSVSTGRVFLDGVSFGTLNKQVFRLDQVVGSVRRGEMTLNVSYNTPNANLAIALTPG